MSNDIDRHVECIASDGYTILQDAIPIELVDQLRSDLERIEREGEIVPAGNIFEGQRTVRIYNLLARGKLYESIPVLDGVLSVVERVLDRGCLVSSLSSI